MALRTRYMENGGGDRYAYPYRIFVPPTAPIIEAVESPGLIDPSQYTGMFHIDDVNSSVPIMCMRANPNIQTIRALVCTPNKAELERRAELGLKTVIGVDRPIKEIIETKNGNGETIQAAIDENGDIAATKKAPPNILPIALAAAAAWFFLM